MADLWVTEPRKPPYRCRRSGRHAPVDGPYFEDSIPYSETGGDDRTLTEYISVGWLRTMAAAPGSPITVLTKDDEMALHAQLEEQSQAVEALQGRIEELESERELLLIRIAESDKGPIDSATLISGIVNALKDSQVEANTPPKRGPGRPRKDGS